jgi:hypothetical protein
MDTYDFDKFMQLSDGAAPYTATGFALVAAANQILNLGAPLPRTDLGIIGELGRMKVAVIIDASAMDISSANEFYRIDILGSNNANGSSPVVLGGIALGYGANTQIPNGTHSAGGAPAGTGSDSFPGRYIIFADMMQNDVAYEYLYLYNTIAGTTPSITYTAFASRWPWSQ